MRNKLERILLAILLGLTIILGLSFWLNTVFNFNLFCATHWDELSKLQATNIPISTGFYISFSVAILLFVVGLYFIYRTEIKRIYIERAKHISAIKKAPITKPDTPVVEQKETDKEIQITEHFVPLSRPPRLNLPKNMAQIAQQQNTTKQKINNTISENPYNPILADIFSDAGYTVKKNPTISGFVPNLFAIGNNEIVWVGGVDCEQGKMINALQKLQSVFQETLEDIEIHISGFILDTLNKFDTNNNMLMIFKSVDELKSFIAANLADAINEENRDTFDSYSEYIDTIIQYIKNV